MGDRSNLVIRAAQKLPPTIFSSSSCS